MNLFDCYITLRAKDETTKPIKDAQKGAEALTGKMKDLSAEYNAAQKKVDDLAREFSESAKKTGSASKETKALAEQLAKAEKEAEQAKKDLDKYNDTIGDTEKQSDKTESSLKKLAGSLGNGLKSAAQIGVAAIATVATSMVAAVEGTREYRNEMAKLDTAFTKMGHSSEAAYGAYSDLQSVLGESDQAVEAASHLAKLTDNEQELEQWTHALTGVYASFGASLPVEGLTEAA